MFERMVENARSEDEPKVGEGESSGRMILRDPPAIDTAKRPADVGRRKIQSEN
jgi:hypothetical protein